MQEAVQTVMKMSPPMLIIVCAAFLNMLLKPFMPEKYLAPIATLASAAVAPWVFDPKTLAYSVPSPGTALVLVGAIMGFIGSVLHRRLDRWLKSRWVTGGNGDTQQFTRSGAAPSPPGRPSSPDGPRRTD